jgi:hypothetical protein
VEPDLFRWRIGNLENLLGSGGDGPIFASHRRVWRPPWHHDGIALWRMFQRAIHGQSVDVLPHNVVFSARPSSLKIAF